MAKDIGALDFIKAIKEGKIPNPTRINEIGENFGLVEFADFGEEGLSRHILNLIYEISTNPSKFGHEKIEAALKYIAPELKDVRGAVTSHKTSFEEDRGKYLDIFSVNFCRSYYEPSVIIGAEMSYKGIKLKENLEIDKSMICSLEQKVRKFEIPFIAVPLGVTASLQQDVFDDFTLRFGVSYDRCSYDREVGRFPDELVFRSQDYLMSKTEVEPLGNFKCFDFRKVLDPENSLLYCGFVRRVGNIIDFANIGPDDMPLFLKDKKKDI